MKLCCFVILVFISVIFTVGGEWGKEGIGRVNSFPTTNQNKDSYSQQLLTERLHTDKQLKRYSQNIQGEQVPEEHPEIKHPMPQNQTNTTNQAKQSSNNKGKDVDTQNVQNQNADNVNNNTAKKLEEEAQTISRVIVVLGSLGASLLLVAIAIAVLYWKVRRQQKLVKSVKFQEDNNNIIGNSDNNNNNNENGNEMKRDDGGGGVGEGENIIASDDSESLYTAHLMNEKSNIINPNSSGGVNNGGFGTGVVGDNLDNEPSESPYIHHNIQQQLSPQPTAPPAEKFEDNNSDIIGSNSNLSTPPLTAPPAYTPTAPPIYALPHIPILYTDGNTYQQPNPHNLEMNNNGGTYTGMPWYAAGPTSQINPPINNAPYQQSNPTIIQSTSTNLNSSFNSHENNDGNDKRQTI